ncbi:hypothetical protein NIES2098_08920 [Calothrix sp. NIES-2098]|nr:hypothetical protein NIES2098_08920 [Calothrix sp. NIES-2098]
MKILPILAITNIVNTNLIKVDKNKRNLYIYTLIFYIFL